MWVVGFDELCGVFLHGSTDLTDQDDSLGLGVREEDFDNVDVLSSREGVTTDTDCEGLTQTDVGGLARESATVDLRMDDRVKVWAHLTAS